MKQDTNNNKLRTIIRRFLSENIDFAPNVSTNDRLSNLRRYVEDNIDLSGYGNYPDQNKIQSVINIFNEEKGWDIKSKGLKNAFIDYLRGMPSILDIATYYDEIRNLLYSIGYDEVKDMDDADIDRLYYNELFKVFFR